MVFLGFLLAMSSALPAQWEREVPRAARPPVIDGRIDPAEWHNAAIIEDFHQVEPKEGGEPSEETIIYLMVDAQALYIGIQCLDSDPDAIIGTQRQRDARLDPDDRVEIILDTFLDRRNAYFFQINPGGSRGDALIANNGSFFNKQWDGIWYGRAIVHENGWSAEMALPGKTLSMDADRGVFGFNVRRFIKRREEVLQWANPSRKRPLFDISSAGAISGLGVLEQGLGLDIRPYITLRGGRAHESNETRRDIEAGLDVR